MYYDGRFQERYSVKGNNMNNKESFEKAITDIKSAISFKDAAQKMRVVNFTEEFAKRGVDIGAGLENQ